MNLENQELKICKLDPNSSKAKRVYDIFMSNPNMVFDIRNMVKTFNNIYKDNAKNRAISLIITRLYAKNKLIRTPTQLNSGYFYSVSNRKLLREVYDDYLVPSNLENKEAIKNLILKNNFTKLETDHKLDLNGIKDFDFIKKYGLNYFYDDKVLTFLVTNFGFLLCDGHILKNLGQLKYFFNQKIDAISFKKDFNSIFQHEYLQLKYRCYCFTLNLCGKPFAILLNYFGVPSGNKVFQPFTVPDWIYNGPNDIKKTFLSVIYGNEGAKPQDNRWRIGFVLSKQKKHIENLLLFFNQIRTMLFHFGITTSHIQLRKQKGREFHGRFYIKGKDNLLKFYNKIGFAYASEKQEELESLLRKGKLIN